jgi:AcrR family transcriptional regulator
MAQIRKLSAAELLGAPPPPKRGRDRLVATANELFYHRGFNAVGIDQVIAEAGVSKTTFYKHFESKDDLLVAAVEQRDRWERDAWARAMVKLGGKSPRGQLLALFDVLDVWFNDPSFNGCIFINAASEFPNPNDPVHQAAAKHKHATRDHIRDLAARAKAHDPEAFADAYMILFEGTLIMRQVHGRNDAAQIARGSVEALLDQHGAIS